MPPLTLENYFGAENTRISNSKISDYLKSKEYFYKKHVLHTIHEEPSPSMMIGKMVDAALTNRSLSAITNNWQLKVKKSDNPELYDYQQLNPENVVTETILEKALEMAQTVLDSDFYKEDCAKNALTQIPLEGIINNVPVCGIPDSIIIVTDSDTATRIIITDWKTSAPGDVATPERWLRKVQAYGYDRQLVMYQMLIAQNIKKFVSRKKKKVIWEFRHVVIENVKDGIYHTHLFNIHHSVLSEACFTILNTIKEIGENLKIGESAFRDKKLSWEDSITLKR